VQREEEREEEWVVECSQNVFFDLKKHDEIRAREKERERERDSALGARQVGHLRER
jgi:hypothetical protein